MAKRKSPYERGYPERSKDVFVTQAMLFAVRDELKEDIKSLRHEMNSKFEGVHAKIADLGAQVYGLRALIEEQNARNIAVMDGLTNLFARQDRVEKRVDDVEKTMTDLRR